jgi:hypothetical protein
MKRSALSIVIALGILAPTAHAKVRTVTPPGNSGVQQYVESIPTVSGGRPTGSVHSVAVAGGGHNGGGSSGGATTGGGGPITASTQRRLAAQGTAGAAAATLARATAPRVSRPGAKTPGSGKAAGSNRSTGTAIQTGGGASAVGSVADAVTGSASTGGLGTLLPVILLVTLLGSGATALLRRPGEA